MTQPILIDASAIRAREKMMTRYGSLINQVYCSPDSPKNEPGLGIEGWAVLFDEPIALQSGEIVVFERGCFDEHLDSHSTDFLLAHDTTEVVGSTNSGLELCVVDEGVAYRMPLTNKRYASTIKRLVESNKQSAISIGITRSKEREEMVGRHKVFFIEHASLTECSLVAEGCCSHAYASLIDVNDSPPLKDSIASPSFKLESTAHNIRTKHRKLMRKFDALSERLSALQQEEPVRPMTADQSNRLETERNEQMRAEWRAKHLGV